MTKLGVIKIIGIAVIFIVGGLMLCQKKQNHKLLSYDDEIFKPYLWGLTYTDDIKQKEPLKKGDNLHPLDLGRTALLLIKDGNENNNQEELALGREYLDFLADSYPSTFENDKIKIWKYQFQWNELKPGWYSGMANSVIALAFWAGYEVFGEEKYKSQAEKAINGVVEPVEWGGCAVKTDNGYWYEEYVQDGLKKENAGFVLNGFLFSLEAVKIFSEIKNDNYYESMFESGIESLKKNSGDYYYPENRWTFYGLNPKIIETPHYAIYDIMLLDSLSMLSNDNFFVEQAMIRRRILSDNYPLEICDSGNGNFKYVFSAVGPPHPYLVDTYPVEITFLNKENQIVGIEKILSPRNLEIPAKSRVFLSGQLAEEAIEYKIIALYGDMSVQWGQGLINKSVKNCAFGPEAVDFLMRCSYDAECESNSKLVRIDPAFQADPSQPGHYSNNQTSIQITPKKNISQKTNKYFGLLLYPQKPISSLKISIYDDQGREASRYYEPLKGGVDNLMLLNWLGFNSIEKLNDSIAKIVLTIYTGKAGMEEKSSVDVNQLLLFKDNVELFNYFQKNSFFYPEQAHKGNIY
ncbi:MAG TPA: D-glucuronyl C5-epimerase family protein [Candidatus Paceibacterota bacterium]|nr:D-glucuronyl C5-epimerase family protein [Candidatus Pacearchaeota archaeon]HRZ50675.1 D-glucuronyl C5-epimerase family protein [Candidatus Paceibacterota bacterium]HSA36428.1 D-glucuronyl C5-epimerase family protein [Candidatus Paceibacterota bacterium]